MGGMSGWWVGVFDLKGSAVGFCASRETGGDGPIYKSQMVVMVMMMMMMMTMMMMMMLMMMMTIPQCSERP